MKLSVSDLSPRGLPTTDDASDARKYDDRCRADTSEFVVVYLQKNERGGVGAEQLRGAHLLPVPAGVNPEIYHNLR